MKRVRLVVVTGLSGSGKTAALKALEDLGFFCVDNLPVTLLPKFLELGVVAGGEVQKVALGMDIRERQFLDRCRQVFEEVSGLGIRAEVLYLEASDETLIRRFSETRRRHPLAGDRSVTQGIREERPLLQDLRAMADVVIDTSGMTVHDLKKALWQYFRQGAEDQTLQVNLLSFGYRHGLPQEADLVFDARFLPNPYFVSDLKNLTGADRRVREFVLGFDEAQEYLRRLCDLVAYLIPLYEKEGKSYLTVAVGCTGGKHRSVTIVEELGRRMEETGRPVRILHRDLEK